MTPFDDFHGWKDEHEMRRQVEQLAAEARWAENAQRPRGEVTAEMVAGMDDMMEVIE